MTGKQLAMGNSLRAMNTSNVFQKLKTMSESKERNLYEEDLGVNERIILKCICGK
jgi:hypothetical protein